MMFSPAVLVLLALVVVSSCEDKSSLPVVFPPAELLPPAPLPRLPAALPIGSYYFPTARAYGLPQPQVLSYQPIYSSPAWYPAGQEERIPAYLSAPSIPPEELRRAIWSSAPRRQLSYSPYYPGSLIPNQVPYPSPYYLI